MRIQTSHVGTYSPMSVACCLLSVVRCLSHVCSKRELTSSRFCAATRKSTNCPSWPFFFWVADFGAFTQRFVIRMVDNARAFHISRHFEGGDSPLVCLLAVLRGRATGRGPINASPRRSALRSSHQASKAKYVTQWAARPAPSIRGGLSHEHIARSASALATRH